MRRAALAVLLVALAGCGSAGAARGERKAIADAKHAHRFAPVAEIFPGNAETVPCAVAAGAPGNVFRGRCSSGATVHADGSANVLFMQDFGPNGRHRWRIRVAPNGAASVTSQPGRGLVQPIP